MKTYCNEAVYKSSDEVSKDYVKLSSKNQSAIVKRIQNKTICHESFEQMVFYI
jgi:hypothetical protein